MAELRTTHTTEGVREAVGGWRAGRETVALVPTMGNLHEGHMSLARLARDYADRIVFSVFVNPTQFGAGEDFESYPRTLARDQEKLATSEAVDLLFAPAEPEIYPFGTEDAVRVVVPKLGEELCGRHRPGHFIGVASVVCRLLNIVLPDVLVLGEKDYQQLVLLRRMIEDLRLPVRVVPAPIQREADGLAMSSRNQYLEPEERERAPALHDALEAVRRALRAGATDYPRLEAEAVRVLHSKGFRPDYVEVRRAADLSRPRREERPDELVVLGAAWIGTTRLIDNLQVVSR
jgi:pantoate--beta-alanine ligase